MDYKVVARVIKQTFKSDVRGFAAEGLWPSDHPLQFWAPPDLRRSLHIERSYRKGRAFPHTRRQSRAGSTHDP